MPQSPPLLTTRGVVKRYGPVVALADANLTVASGEVHALLGANGAGKSTLVKVLTGVVAADEGAIEVGGNQLRMTKPSDASAAGVATVFQDPSLAPDLTVAQNLRLSRIEGSAIRPWLERLSVGDVDFGERIANLPLPTLRMLDLARALASDPLLLMLDEITAALPSKLAERVFDVIRERRERERSVLFISHRLGEVLAHCDQVTVLRDGRDVASFPAAEGNEARLVQEMLGERAAAAIEEGGPAATERTGPEGPVRLEGRELRLGKRLNGLSLQVHAGEIVGVVGLEGQGEKVLFDVLAGERRPDAGELLIDGEPLTARSPYDAIRRGVVLVPAERFDALLPKRPTSENLSTPLYNRMRRWLLRDEADERRRVNDAIGRLSIDMRAGRQVRRLSGGNQQKVSVGRWLAAGFHTLLCFDPTRGIDVGTKQQIYELLKELAEEGSAVLFYTSELEEVPLVCDRVLVLHDGRIVHEQDAATADESTLLTAAHELGHEDNEGHEEAST